VAYAWKEGMAPRQLQLANRECGDVLLRLNYGTEAEVCAYRRKRRRFLIAERKWLNVVKKMK
jgi:hypothetical protein